MNVLNIGTTYTSRPATFKDIPAMVNLFNTALIDMWGKEDWDVETAESQMCDPEVDINEQVRLWYDADNTLLGLGTVWMWGKPPVRPQTNAYVLPNHVNRFDLSLEIMAWGEATARRIAIPQCPPDAQVAIVTFTVMGYAFNESMLTTYGMTQVRRFLSMKIDLHDNMPAPLLPDRFAIRTIRYPEEARELYRIGDAAFSDHYGHIDDPDGTNFEQWQHHIFNSPHFDPTLWFVAESNGEYAGFAWCHLGMPEDPKLGWVDTLGTLSAFRKNGVGLALLHHAFRGFYLRGMTRAGLGVDASSLTGATRLYERAGMKAHTAWDTYAKVIREGVDLIRQ